jgi:hypothetical protein
MQIIVSKLIMMNANLFKSLLKIVTTPKNAYKLTKINIRTNPIEY